MTVYRTRNSVYEVDEAGKRARRLEGVNKPTDYTGEDGVWKDIDNAVVLTGIAGKDILAIYWAGDDPFRQEATFTSAVQSVEPALPLEA